MADLCSSKIKVGVFDVWLPVPLQVRGRKGCGLENELVETSAAEGVWMQVGRRKLGPKRRYRVWKGLLVEGHLKPIFATRTLNG